VTDCGRSFQGWGHPGERSLRDEVSDHAWASSDRWRWGHTQPTGHPGIPCITFFAAHYVSKRLGAAGKRDERGDPASPPVPPPPSARQLSFEWVRRPEKRKPAEQTRLDAIRAESAELAAALDLADEFAGLIRRRSQGTLSDWLARGEACVNPELRRFAEGIRRDEAAVLAAVTQRWSNGPVEGHINRLKTVKRQMYGRAGFVLLRARVLKAV
jgi:hypothetical protein